MAKHKRKTIDQHFNFTDPTEFAIFLVWGVAVAALFASLIN